MTQSQSIILSSGCQMPSVGLGLWKIEPTATAEMVYRAIEVGYRHIDAACDYGNEPQAGEGIRRAIEVGLCRREDLWVTSKLWNTYHKSQHVRPAIERTLRDLQLDYLDSYLVHFPIALKHVPIEDRYPPGWIYDPSAATPRMETEAVSMFETWSAMEDLQRSGLCKHIGVSNYSVALIRELLTGAQIRPAVLQVESHPYLVQEKLMRYCQQEHIAFTAFSPLGAGSYVSLGMAEPTDSVLTNPIIQQIALRHQVSPAQVSLRWGVQRGSAVIPKTSQPARLIENLGLFDFQLSEAEMLQISRLDRHQRFNDPGVFCEKAFGCFYPIYD